MSGVCQCGCGGTPAPKTPRLLARYIHGHNRRRPPNERFRAFVAEQPNGCHLWVGSLGSGTGYGQFGVAHGTMVNAHRYAYELAVGPVPEGLVIDHLCRNRACVNPAHMEPVTQSVNVQRGACSRLNAEVAARIREMVTGGRSQSDVAKEFGVHNSTISRICTGTSWRLHDMNVELDQWKAQP